MASEIEIRKKVQAKAGERQKKREAFDARKKAQRVARRLQRNRQRLKDALAALRKLKNPKTALEKKRARENLGEKRRLEALIVELRKRLPKADTSTGNPVAPSRGTGVDDAGPVGQEARRDKSKDADKGKTEDKSGAVTETKKKGREGDIGRTSMKDFKKKTKSDGGPRPDTDEKKKKRKLRLLGSDRYGTKIYKGRKIYLGQR